MNVKKGAELSGKIIDRTKDLRVFVRSNFITENCNADVYLGSS